MADAGDPPVLRDELMVRVEGGGIDADRASLDALWSAVDAGFITPADASRLVFSR